MNMRRPIYVPATSLVALPKNKDSDLVCILYDGAIYVFDRSCSPYKAKGWYKKQDAKEIATIWWSTSEEISYLVKEGSDTQTINLESPTLHKKYECINLATRGKKLRPETDLKTPDQMKRLAYVLDVFPGLYCQMITETGCSPREILKAPLLIVSFVSP